MNRRLLSALFVVILSACQPQNSQNQYSDSDVGISHAVEFGTVLNRREVQIQGKNSETGTLLGAGAGAGGGSYIGNGSGNAWATAGGALVGAVAGHFAEQAMEDRIGYEYVVRLQSGDTKTIVQEKAEGDVVFNPGDYVMLQYCDTGEHSRKCTEGKSYQRLLPIAKLPPYTPPKQRRS
jgi:outer membrane lipoprotein SlyB